MSIDRFPTSTAGERRGSNGQAQVVRAKSSGHWRFVVVGMLLAHAAVMAAAVVIALRSPYQVIPDYYERAVNWDAQRPKPQPSSGESR